MTRIGVVSRSFTGALVALLVVGFAPASGAQDADQEALLARVRELMEARGGTRYVMPAPNSRSVIFVIDVSTSMYFFLERGSMRGSTIDSFYAAYDAGDMNAAFEAFRAAAIPTVRVTDYGWNGLGVPMTTDSGTEVGDIIYRDVEGVFRRAAEITDEDVANYIAYLEAVIQGLEGS